MPLLYDPSNDPPNIPLTHPLIYPPYIPSATVERHSSLYETAPAYVTDQPAFLNAAAVVRVTDPGMVGPTGTHTLHPTSHTLHPTPYTLHPTPYTLHCTPYTVHPET